MTFLIVLLLLEITRQTTTFAQEGTVPKETCQFLTYNFEHGFIEDPNIDITTLVGPNRANLESLKQIIIVNEDCSIATDLKIFEITYNEGVGNLGLPTITQRIKIQVSAQSNITSPTEKSTQLNLCLESVTRKVGSDNKLADSVPLNSTVNGTVSGLIKRVTVGQESCCQAIYESSESICCRPGFIEDGDNCACSQGKFLNLNKTSCDDCPEDTYQPNEKSSDCLPCPNGTTTYGTTGRNKKDFCLDACLPGQRHNSSSEECEICPKNTYQPLEGQLNCMPCLSDRITKNIGSKKFEDCVESCQPGSFYSFASGSCEFCPQSSFQTKQGQFNCTPCGAEKITISNGSKTQEDCITNCSRGTFFNGETDKCDVCPLHTYQRKFGTTKCIDCPDGRITVNTSSHMLENCIQNCSAGSIYNFTTKDCENCPLNTYQPKPGQTKCIACSMNKITVTVSTVREQDCIQECKPGERYNHQSFECVSCPPDTYKPTKGETECIKCPNGTVTYTDGLHINITDCGEECDPGYYFNITLWGCAKCPRNTTQQNSGQTSCNECKLNNRIITEMEGTVSESDCIEFCEAGQFFNKTILTCESCENKTYQPNPGTSQCLKCPDNYTTLGEGSTDINQCVKVCQPGSHHVDKTQQCSLCKKGEYQNKWGQDSCIKCLEDKTTFQEGSTKSEDCFEVCIPGEYHNNFTDTCDPCPRNEYQPSMQQFSCIRCPNGTLTQGERSTSLNDCLWDCDRGFYHNSTSNTCDKCPIGTYKDITGHMECFKCDRDYTTMTKGSVNLTQCIRFCFEGNFFNVTSKRCQPCPVNSYQNLDAATTCLSCPNNGITRGTGTRSLEECNALATPEESSADNLQLVVTVPVVSSVVLLSFCLLVIFYRRWRIKENERRMSGRPLDPRGRRSEDYESGERPKLNSTTSMPNHHYKMQGSGLKPDVLRPSTRNADIPEELEIPRENLKFLGQVLGKGNFGVVEKAILLKDGTENVVAVKMIKGGGTFSDEKELFDELEMLVSLSSHPHPNIVNLIGGSTTNEGPLFVVVEYCGEGNLLKYLQKNQAQLKPRQEYVNIFPKAAKPGIQYEWKLHKALEVCNGMAHLAKFKIIHRDVAARNVLLDEKWVAKISDFGMARDIYVKQIYRKDTEGFLPVRWMAIESLESFIYTTQSDVWSFGILMWEIISEGRVPYNNILDHTQLLNYIKSGRTMKRPKNCPKDFYHIMEKCWSTNPSDRPTFESLKDAIEALYEDEVHKDDALPQRIFRKFSSRRKRRKHDEGGENSGRKPSARKTLSNSSGTKIEKIEEEEQLGAKTSEKPREDVIKMEVLEKPETEEPLNKEYENAGYLRTGSSTSEEQDVPRPKASNEIELDTILETPFSRTTEDLQSTGNDSRNNTSEVEMLDSAEVATLSLQHGNEKEQPSTSADADESSSAVDERTDAKKDQRMSSTDC